jgi:CRISPR-associated protein Cas1
VSNFLPRPPLETLAPANDRWTPLYLEHGRLEVDDSSIKWIGADGLVCRIPAATLSALLLGPGSTATHAAIKACADSNTPLCWTGAEGMHYYATGLKPTHDNTNARHQAELWGNRNTRIAIARRMFAHRFGPDSAKAARSVAELRGMEGLRVRTTYAELGAKYGVTWRGRDYDKTNWNLSDDINRALSAANASLYALCAAVITTMGYLPQLGFIHEAGNIPFVCDIADLFKVETSYTAAFETVAAAPPRAQLEEQTRTALKRHLETHRILPRLPKILDEILTAP